MRYNTPIMGSAVSEIFEVIGGMFSALFDALPKIISFILWVLSAFIILPCVFVAGTMYSDWQKWGEEF
jgi:hypothetical protein